MELGFGTVPALNLLKVPYLGAHLAENDFRERRSTLHLYKLWEAARGRKQIPCLMDFDLGFIERVGGGCFLLEFEENGSPAKFKYFGRDLAAGVKRDLTGYSIAAVPQASLLAHVIAHCEEAIVGDKPVGLDGVFSQNPTEHLLYRSILLPFTKHESKAECVLGCLQFRRVPARQPIGSGIARAKPLMLRLEQVREAQDTSSVTSPEQFKTVLSRARQQAAMLSAEETRRARRAERMLAAVHSGLRRAIWPTRAVQFVKSAPAIGKAMVPQRHSCEFALLLARRIDGEASRYEIVSITNPLLLNMALRSAFIASQKMHRRTRRRRGKP
jgi:hypothetical protein